MVFGFGRKPLTMEQEDPNGSKRYNFTFGTYTRGELQDHMEQLLSRYQYAPLDGAEAVLDLFRDAKNAELLNNSPTVQSVVIGSSSRPGPVATFLEWAVERQEKRGEVDAATVERFTKVKERYEAMLAGVESAIANAEDPKRTKRYEFTFGSMTTQGLQDRIESALTRSEHASQYVENAYMAGAEEMIAEFSMPQNMKVLQDSPNVRRYVLGAVGDKGPIQFMLEKAAEQVEARGLNAVHPDRMRLEKLEGSYERLRKEVIKSELRPAPASFGERTQTGHSQGQNSRV